MRTLQEFYAEAEKQCELKEKKLLGITVDIENEAVFLLTEKNGQTSRDLWPEAAGVWEGIYRGLRLEQ